MADCDRFFSRWGHLIAGEEDDRKALRKLQLYLHPDRHPEEEEKYTEEFKQLGNCKDRIPSYTRSPRSQASPVRVRSPVRGRQPSPPRRQPISRAKYEEMDRQLAEWEIQQRDERIRQRRLEKTRQEASERAEQEREQQVRDEMARRKQTLADQIERERQRVAAERRAQRLRDEEDERRYQQRRAEREKRFKDEDDIPIVNIQDIWREERERAIREQSEQELWEKAKKQASRKPPSWCGRFCSMGQEYEYEGSKMRGGGKGGNRQNGW